MTVFAYGQIILYIAVLAALSVPLGIYIYRVMQGEAIAVSRLFKPAERVLYRSLGIDEPAMMNWREYALRLIVFNAVGALLLYAIQRGQGWLPLNPAHFGAVQPDSAFNTAVSFTSNTSWQSYAGESTLSYLTQMLGISVQSFLSGATGIAVLMALLRGLSLNRTLGNVWVDLTRAPLFVLLPLSCVVAVALVAQGSIQNLRSNQVATLVKPANYQETKLDALGRAQLDIHGQPVIETVTTRTQVLPMGPVASSVTIIRSFGRCGGRRCDFRLSALRSAATLGLDQPAAFQKKTPLEHRYRTRLVAFTVAAQNRWPEKK
jgi:K+-transporting ATPase ATPase A chain